MDERIEINRRNWNERTPIHASSEMYNVEGFKAGGITLTDIEIDEIGPVAGKSLLHLQCHFGMDTMFVGAPRSRGDRRGPVGRFNRSCE